VIQLLSAPIEAGRIRNIRFSIYSGTDRVRLNFFSKNRIGYSNLNFNTPITTVECSNEITITITIIDNKSSAVAEIGDHGHNRHGPKRGGGVVPLSRSAGNPSNTMWPAPRSNSVPSGVFIHRAVWPQ